MRLFQSIILAGSLAAVLMSCEKKVVTQLETESNFGKGNLKIIHASAYITNYSVRLKVNDQWVSSVITNATPFPGGGLNTGGSSSPWYLALNPGNAKISLIIPKVGTGVDSVVLYTGTVNLEHDKYYSAYLTDTAATTQLVFITDNIEAPASDVSRFRFVNLMPNQPSLDLYWGANKVASDIQYTLPSPEFTLPRGDTARWYIRPAGAAANTNPIASYPTSQTIPPQRVMTVFARGYNGGTGNRAPNVSLLYNY